MAAGLGFKTFNAGDVLSAADTNGYLMQGVLVFASAAARDAAITSPQEGQFAYLKDTNVTTYYTGSAWANLDTTGMTNPMTTTGDTIYSSSGSTPARLGIGTAGQVLKVNSGATAPEWATPASSGGMTLLSTTTFSSAVTTLSSFGGYKSLKLIMYGFAWTSTNAPLNIRPNGSNANAYITGTRGTTVYSIINGAMNITDVDWNRNESNHVFVINFDNYTDTSMNKVFDFHGYFIQPPASNEKTPLIGAGSWLDTSAITSLEIRLAGTVYQGTALLYGVN